ncbi:MAG: hypothetical protein LBM98_05590 [Oscillospiraceae bacterium]|nr:hypothetical protein [Oscillospiraceae bacterium]
MRYVGMRPARQSSAAVRRYVCFPPGTGLLRTCNVLRIASVPVLRNDGGGRFAVTKVGRRLDEGWTKVGRRLDEGYARGQGAPCPSLRAAERLRYVGMRPARQSSAAVRRYVCFPPGTGLLRTCNVLRIASVPVLRNDSARGRFAGTGTGAPPLRGRALRQGTR